MKKKPSSLPPILLLLVFFISGCGNKSLNNYSIEKENNNIATSTEESKEIPEKIDNTTASSTTEVPMEDIKSEIDTSDWQTYRNEEFGFMFKYHPYWKTAPTDVGVNSENESYMIDILVLYDGEKEKARLLQIGIKNLEKSEKTQESDKKEKEYIINDIPFDIYYSSNYFGYDCVAIGIKNNLEFRFRLGHYSTNKDAEEIMLEIINTLKVE